MAATAGATPPLGPQPTVTMVAVPSTPVGTVRNYSSLNGRFVTKVGVPTAQETRIGEIFAAIKHEVVSNGFVDPRTGTHFGVPSDTTKYYLTVHYDRPQAAELEIEEHNGAGGVTKRTVIIDLTDSKRFDAALDASGKTTVDRIRDLVTEGKTILLQNSDLRLTKKMYVPTYTSYGRSDGDAVFESRAGIFKQGPITHFPRLSPLIESQLASKTEAEKRQFMAELNAAVLFIDGQKSYLRTRIKELDTTTLKNLEKTADEKKKALEALIKKKATKAAEKATLEREIQDLEIKISSNVTAIADLGTRILAPGTTPEEAAKLTAQKDKLVAANDKLDTQIRGKRAKIATVEGSISALDADIVRARQESGTAAQAFADAQEPKLKLEAALKRLESLDLFAISWGLLYRDKDPQDSLTALKAIQTQLRETEKSWYHKMIPFDVDVRERNIEEYNADILSMFRPDFASRYELYQELGLEMPKGHGAHAFEIDLLQTVLEHLGQGTRPNFDELKKLSGIDDTEYPNFSRFLEESMTKANEYHAKMAGVAPTIPAYIFRDDKIKQYLAAAFDQDKLGKFLATIGVR